MSTETTPMLAHDVPLRPDMLVRLILPRVFTSDEAERIARFVHSLVLDSGETDRLRAERDDALRDVQVMEGTEDAIRVVLEAQVAAGDAQRVAAGWLPPDEAERLKAESHELRVVLGTIREGDDYDPGAMVMLYDQAVDRADRAEAERAAVQPVIDAARKMIAKRDQKYGPNRGDPAWWSGHDFEWDLVKAIDALDAADGQPEGPTT